MWKAAFTGRSEGGGSSAGKTSEPRRKKSHRAESVTSSRPRDDDDRRRSSRVGSVYDDGEETMYGVASSGPVGYGSSPSHMSSTAPLTASALRLLPDDEEEWEDDDRDARSERKSRRGDGERRRKSGGKEREKDSGKEREKGKSKDRSRSHSREKERKKSTSKASVPTSKSSGKEKERARHDSQSEKERDSKHRPRLVDSSDREASRALPEMGSFEQFPGQYAGGHMGPLPPHQQDAIMSGALPNSAPQQGQFPGQDPYHDPSSSRPPLKHSSHSWGAAADYYLDAGESVQHQPGVRINSPNMLVNPDQHLVAASAQPIPAMDTGDGAANDFYSNNTHGAGTSASAPVTPASKPKPNKPNKQSSWSAFKPGKTSKPGKVGKPGKNSSSNTATAAMAAAAGVGVLSGASLMQSSSSQQSTSNTSKPGRRDSDGNVYYGPPPHSQSSSYTYGVPGSTTAQGSVNAHGAQSTNGAGSSSAYYTNDYGTAHTTPGKQSTNSSSNVPLYAAGAAAAAAGLAAHGIKQHHQQSGHNITSSSNYGGGGQGPPQPPRPGFSHYPSSGGGNTGMHQLHHEHEHRGPMTRLKDGLLNLISSPEDTAKMEMYTEYIGVCKHCFDPRTSPWDAPRQHHYHKTSRRDSFEELRRRRSNDRLGRKGSNDSHRRAGGVRVDKDNRYYASDSSRKRRESGKATGILGAGLAAAGVATAANAIFGDGRKDFDDTYSVKSGHRERSAARRRSRSSSREQRRKSTHGVLRASDREEFVTVRRKDGTVERRRVRKQSRSSSREGRANNLFGVAAGAALGAGAASTGMRRRSRSQSRDSKGRRSERRSAKSSYGREDEPVSAGIFGGFFSPPKKRRTSRKDHQNKPRGFFTFSNSSSSSSNSELAFGEAFSSRTSLPLRRKSSARSSTKRSRRTSDDHLAATVAGIGATAAALAAAQKGGRINKRSSKVDLGARKDVNKRGRTHTHGSPGSSDDDWEDELPSDIDDDSSIDGGLAFGDFGSRRVSSRQSLESINSQSSAGGLGAWGWRWGGKDKKRQSRTSTSPPPSHVPSTSDGFNGAANGHHADAGRLDDTGRRLPSMTSISSPSVPTQPLQVVDPQPIFDAGTPGRRHPSMPGAFDQGSPPIYRPGPAPLQQPQPTTPIKAAFTQNVSGLEESNWGRSSPRTSGSFAQDAALIGAGALATAGIIAATSSANSSSKKSRDSVGSNVRFGLTEDQQRKEDRERRKEEKRADEERRRADRTRALKEEAERATRESESSKAEVEARERRQEEIRRAREDENRRVAESKLAAARREADEQAQLHRERQAEQQRSIREKEEVYRREQLRLVEEARQQEEQREADERERFLRQQQEGERRAKERKDGERRMSKSGRSRGQSVSEQSEKKQSSAWTPVAGAAAAAAVGAVIAGRESRDRNVRDEPHSASRPNDQPYQAKEVIPQSSRDGEPLIDDDIFDPDFFKRKHNPEERARYEELARKAADKVVSDRERAYEDHSTYAEFFAPKDVLSESAEGKTKVLGPNADNDIQTYHARDASMLLHLDGARYGPTYGQSKHAPFGVPKLNLISPTPPITESSPVRVKASQSSTTPSSPLSRSTQPAEEGFPDVETDSDGKAERLNRSISWGEDKTHIYDVQTPESYNEKERESYITSPDVKAASREDASSKKIPREAVVEDASPNGQSKTTTYNEDELAKHYRESVQRDYNSGTTFTPQLPLYRQPFVDSVSDFSIHLPSPGAEGAPPVRGHVEGEIDEPTTVKEKTPRVPGGFDDDADSDDTPRKTLSFTNRREDEARLAGTSGEKEDVSEPAWEPPLSKKDKKKREKAGKEVVPDPAVEEAAAWEPPLSKKEQKKREKAAKRSSIMDSEPLTPAVAGVNDRDMLVDSARTFETVDEPAWEPPLSKKEQKKRDKAKKQGFADIVSSIDTLPRDDKKPEPVEDRGREASPSAGDEPTPTKKEQRKLDKQVKKSGFGGFADVADILLASGGIAAATGALDSTEDDEVGSAGKKKGKKAKKAKLGEPLDREIIEDESASQAVGSSAMPGGWDVEQESPSPKDATSAAQTAFEPFQYQVHDDGANTPPAAPEPPLAQETDPWAEFSEPKKSKKKSKRNSSAFNVPEVSSPLRTEVAWDDYVSGDKSTANATGVRGETSHTNGHGKDKDSETSHSERTTGEPTSARSDRRGSDYFGDSRQEASTSSERMSPDGARSVASAPTPSRRDSSRRGSDFFDEPSYAYETQSVAASEPVDAHNSSKKSKRRSRNEDDEPRRSRRDDDDDTRSVTSSRSRRDKEESPSVKKDKKSGILGSLFGRKPEGSRDAPRDAKSSKDAEDEDARRRRKKKNRDSELGDEDDDTPSMQSEVRDRRHRSRSDYGGEDDDDSRSMKSGARHKSHRSETGKEDSRERRRRSIQDSDNDKDISDGGKRNHHRRRSGDDSRSSSRHESRSESGHRHHHGRKTDEDTKDQSFLGMRVEDLPPLPADVPAMSSPDTTGKREQGVSTTARTGQVVGTVRHIDDHDETETPVEGTLSPETPFASTESLSPRPGSSHKTASSTAVPLRFPFGHAPLTPTLGHTRERSMSFSSSTAPATVSSPSSPVSARKSRQDRPRSTEIKPLYLVERNRKTPEVEDALPSLPSSGPSSRASSVHLSDAYESAVEELESQGVNKEKKLRLDIDGAQKWIEEHGDVLGSKETTPKASEAQQQLFFPADAGRQVKQEPQFYTWEDFAREERGREMEDHLPPLPRSRSESPLKADQHSVSGAVKAGAAAAVLGTAAVYATNALRQQSPERANAEQDLALQGPSSSDTVAKPESESKSDATLSRESSMKKKGKKAKKLQWQNEEEAASVREPSASDKARQPGPDAISQPIEERGVFASAAAHTMPVFSHRINSQEHSERITSASSLLHDGKRQGLDTISDDTRDLSEPAGDVPTAPKEQIVEGDDRPSTSYTIPTAKAEPAPLVVEQRNIAAGMDDASSLPAELKQAPQLTRKQSKKSRKKQHSVSLFEHDQTPVAPNMEGVEQDHAQDASSPQIKFGVSDFSNFNQSSAAGWHDSQVEAFSHAMLQQAGKSQTASEVRSSRDLNAEQAAIDVGVDAPIEINSAPVDPTDDFASVSSKKQAKKDKKKKNRKASASLGEPGEAELEIADVPEPARELVGDSITPNEGPVPFSSKKSKKDKKDKKRQSLAWDRIDAEAESASQSEQAEPEVKEAEQDRQLAIEEPVSASMSGKGAENYTKERSSTWDGSEVSGENASRAELGNVVVANEETYAIAYGFDHPSTDIQVGSKLDRQVSVPVTSDTEMPAADAFLPATSKKGKKSKKSRQSMTWSDSVVDTAPVVATPDQDDGAVFVDANEEHVPLESQRAVSHAQTVPKERMTEDIVAAAGAAGAGAAVAKLSQSVRSIPEPTMDEMVPVASKKSKKQRKQSKGLSWTELDDEALPLSGPQEHVVDGEESAGVNDSYDVEGEAPKVSGAEGKLSTPAVFKSPDHVESGPRETGGEVAANADPIIPVSRKQSKKDKKKNHKSQAWESESEQATSAPNDEAIVHRNGQAQIAHESSGPAQSFNMSADSNSEDLSLSEPSRKQSKKNNKMNRQPSAWDIESGADDTHEQASSAVEFNAINTQTPPTTRLLDQDDAPENIPLPPDSSNDNADTRGLEDADGGGNAHETDDFFGPAEPVMEEPSRMTEDLDAFGELDARGIEREERRAAREAAESARLADLTRERPKDENYASMLTDRKPATKKGSKKGRKSISSAMPPSPMVSGQPSAEGVSTDEIQQDDERVTKPIESEPSKDLASAKFPVSAKEPAGEELWPSSSKQKSKTGKQGRKSISETATTGGSSIRAVEDVPVSFEQTLKEESNAPQTQDAGASSAIPESMSPDIELNLVDHQSATPDAEAEELVGASTPKKGKKKGNKGKNGGASDSVDQRLPPIAREESDVREADGSTDNRTSVERNAGDAVQHDLVPRTEEVGNGKSATETMERLIETPDVTLEHSSLPAEALPEPAPQDDLGLPTPQSSEKLEKTGDKSKEVQEEPEKHNLWELKQSDVTNPVLDDDVPHEPVQTEDVDVWALPGKKKGKKGKKAKQSTAGDGELTPELSKLPEPAHANQGPVDPASLEPQKSASFANDDDWATPAKGKRVKKGKKNKSLWNDDEPVHDIAQEVPPNTSEVALPDHSQLEQDVLKNAYPDTANPSKHATSVQSHQAGEASVLAKSGLTREEPDSHIVPGVEHGDITGPTRDVENDSTEQVHAAGSFVFKASKENSVQVSAPDARTETETGDTEPVEDQWASFSVKASKKDKKKARKSKSSTPAVVGNDQATETVEPSSERTAATTEVVADDMPLEDQDVRSTALVEDPETETWASFSSSKKTKKDKKKVKKGGVSSPALEIDGEPSHTTRKLSEQLTDETSTHGPQIALPAEESTTVDKSLSDMERGDAGSGEAPVSVKQQPTGFSHDDEQTRGSEETNGAAISSDPAQDIDFAATLAAGLADSGFNPDMVINDPVFHRRASPPGSLPEADPEETFSTTISRRKKGKKSKSDNNEDTPPEATGALVSATAQSQKPADDFNDTISRGFQGTGFDPSLLDKALASSNDAPLENFVDGEPEFSLATSKRKKGKNGKKVFGNEEDLAVGVAPNEAPDLGILLNVEDQKIDGPQDNVSQPPSSLTLERNPEQLTPPFGANDSTRDSDDPAPRLGLEGDGEMDVDEMDKAYKAYKKNKRKQRKLKASTKIDGSSDNPESAVDTEKSAAASDTEGWARSMATEGPSASTYGLAAAGVVGLAARSLNVVETHQKSGNTSQAPASTESGGWSFTPLDEAHQDKPDARLHDTKEHEPIRDSGYEEANRSLQNSERSSREVPATVRTTSSRESLRNRRSLEPLRVSTGSTPDEECSAKTPERRAEGTSHDALHAHTRNPSADTTLLPTTSVRSSSQPQSHDPRTPSSRSEAPDYFQSRTAFEDRATKASSHGDSFSGSSASHDRSSFSPVGTSGPLSPRAPLRSIAEENHSVKRGKADADIGGFRQLKVTKRSETPQGIQGIRDRHVTLSPEHSIPETTPLQSARATSNPLSTDDIIKRLSWPAVDEENDTVNIDRSTSRRAIMPDMRSPSGMSTRSTTSGTYGRSAQELRSFSRNSNASNQSSTPSLRRINLSGDLRAASRRGETGSSVSGTTPNTIPFEAPPTPPLNDDELNSGSASRAADMSDVFQGYGDAAESHVSPTRPPSVRKRQSMHINELESRLDSLVAENRALQEARQSQDSSRYVVNDQNLLETLQQREIELQAKDAEINQIKAMLQPMQEDIARLTEMNTGLTEANRNLVDDTNGRYATLQAEHAQAHEQWQSTTRNLENMQQEHGRITSGMKDILEAEIATALADKNAEILRLREQLDIATEQIRALQVQIQSSNSNDFLIQRDEDYFDGSCQKLCQHVQQWVLRFSKLSDNRVCRLSTELNDDKLEARLDNAVLDGSDVDNLLGDRIRRRDVFMSVVMTMVWEYIFTRYLFGMDREQRQKLKALEKLLSDVGPPRAVAHWRATTLTLLSKRPNFSNQCAMDTEAVAIEIFGVLSSLLPPPSASEQQLLTSLQKVIRIAVDLSIEMRIQRAEYIMLPPLQPEYDTNGDLVRKVHFNASLMNERSGFFSSNEELAAEHAVVKIVLFPLVVKKGDDVGEGEEEIVVCPAQVLVKNDAGKGKKVVRVMSGAMEIDDPIRSRSRLSSKPSMMSEGGAF